MPAAQTCDGPCRPLSTPFKENLRFGMTLAEAKAARPDVAKAESPEALGDRGTGSERIRRTLALAGWAPPLDSSLAATRVCMASELVGREATCCLDFHPTLGRLACATEAAFEREALLAMIRQVEKVYGPPQQGPIPPNAYGFEALSDTVWQSDGAGLRIHFPYGSLFGAGLSPSADDLLKATMHPLHQLVMTQTSAAWNEAVQRVESERKRQHDAEQARAKAERAQAETERQRALETAREERKKLGLPPDPL
jgi:hypothetical protein